MKWLRKILDTYIEIGVKYAPSYRYFNAYYSIPLIIAFSVVLLIVYDWDLKLLWIKRQLSPNIIKVEEINLRGNDNVSIKWTCDSYCDTVTIYENHKVCYVDFKNSGENIFLIFLNSKMVDRKIQYKNTYWKGFKYNFKIVKNKDSLIIELKIN